MRNSGHTTTQNMDAVTAQLSTVQAKAAELAAPVVAPIADAAGPIADKIVATPAWATASSYYAQVQPVTSTFSTEEWALLYCAVVPALALVLQLIYSYLCCCCCSKPTHVKIAPAPPKGALPKKGEKPSPPPKRSAPPPKASPPPKGKGSPAPPKGKNGKSLVA